MLAATLLPTLLVCSQNGAQSQPPVEPPVHRDPRCIAVVGTADVHGAIDPLTRLNGKRAPAHGGLIALSGYLRTLRKRYANRVVLLDGGDLYQGSMASNLSRGRAIIEAYNLLGFNAAAVGNHEFDFGATERRPDDLIGVLRSRIAEARFPFLAVNIIDRGSATPASWPNLRPSTLVRAGETVVGVIGAASPETASVTDAQNVASLSFVDPTKAIVASAKRLRASGAQIVALTAHMGGECTDLSNPHDTSSCSEDSELLALLRHLPRGTVDVAVGGHTHQPFAYFVNGTAAIQVAAHARQLAWVDVCLDRSGALDRKRVRINGPVNVCLQQWSDGGCDGRDSESPTRAASFFGRLVKPQASLVTAMKPFLDAVAVAQARKLGVHLRKPLVRGDEGELGELVAESLRRAADADMGIQNLGGVRADLAAGEVTFGDVYRALPFENYVVRVVLTGEQLASMIRHMVRRRSGEIPYVAGFSVEQCGEELVLRTTDGAPLDLRSDYAVGTNDFLLYGGDGLRFVFDAVREANKRVIDQSTRDAFTRLLRERYSSP